LNQSLDGYVDHLEFGPPDPALFRHFTNASTRRLGEAGRSGWCRARWSRLARTPLLLPMTSRRQCGH
jgi:hypothetical protein